jgi:hypothetical protein
MSFNVIASFLEVIFLLAPVFFSFIILKQKKKIDFVATNVTDFMNL